jgi:hypothetical protein
MIKKKKRTKKAAAQKSAKKGRKTPVKKETNLAEVRKQVTEIVQSEAALMAQAVVQEGKKGQVAPVRYLFEMANIFPVQANAEQATEEEDCLAKILLARMEAPAKPEKEDDDEADGTEVSTEEEARPARAAIRGQESPRQTPASGDSEKKETVGTTVGTTSSVT